MTLPDHITRCDGFGDGPDDWLDECGDCQRRTAPRGADAVVAPPPSIVTLWCENYIPPVRPEDQRLRELARQQGLYAPPTTEGSQPGPRP